MSNNKFKILVVEDEANICSFVETLLVTNGYQVLTAPDAGDGSVRCFCRTRRTSSSLDLGLPDGDGLEFIRAVRARARRRRSSCCLPARRNRTRSPRSTLGANDYITKPFGTAELTARVRAALRSHHQATGRAAGRKVRRRAV